ncbi:MAG TPA: hypothetical protein VFX18_01895, partial [Candidatus Nitrosocosmicus sp.]|nr:hypothetical protein [Candidatus Nitrosocosmicus sp.]
MGIFSYKERFNNLINKGNKAVLKDEQQETNLNKALGIDETRLQIIEHQQQEDDETLSKKFFTAIYGQDDIKLNLYSAVTSKDQVNTLLYGPPACSKSLFMKVIEEKCNDTFYFDCSQATSAGLI